MRSNRDLTVCMVIALLFLVGCKSVKTPQTPTLQLLKIEGYEGDQQLFKPHGFGRMNYADTTHAIRTYEGTWRHGVPMGHGTMVYRNGDSYQGAVKAFKREGQGTLYLKKGGIYEGVWEADTLQGYGTYTYENSRYTGYWSGLLLDSARIEYANGDYYEGYLDSLHREEGIGFKRYADGGLYRGGWKSGKRHGKGKFIAADGKVQIGLWRTDVYRGEELYHSKKRVYGIDISRHQHYRNAGIDWKRLEIVKLGKYHDENANDALPLPVSFVIVKATEGRNYINPFYAKDFADAKKQKIARGAYHFFTDAPVALQANNFIKTVKLSKGDFPPVLDLEPSKRQIAAMGGEEQMLLNALTWLQMIEKHYGVRPIIYVGQNFATDIVLKHAEEEFKDYCFWVARYNSYSPSVDRLIWQIDDTGRVTGIHGPVDINMFNGTTEQLDEYLKTDGIK